MKIYIESSWLAPLITAAIAIAAFVSVEMRLFPAPYYIGKAIPFAFGGNVIVLIYQLSMKRFRVAMKTSLFSILPGLICLLWFVQTA